MNRLFPLFLAAVLSTSVFAQDDVERVKSVVKNGRCSDAIAPLQKIYSSSFRKIEGEKASLTATGTFNSTRVENLTSGLTWATSNGKYFTESGSVTKM